MSKERLGDKVKYISQSILRKKMMVRKRRKAGRQEGTETRERKRERTSGKEGRGGAGREEDGRENKEKNEGIMGWHKESQR